MTKTLVRWSLVTMIALMLCGCRGNLRENIVYEHMFNKPDCRPRPCPRQCPEFELPPGGPYLKTPEPRPITN